MSQEHISEWNRLNVCACVSLLCRVRTLHSSLAICLSNLMCIIGTILCRTKIDSSTYIRSAPLKTPLSILLGIETASYDNNVLVSSQNNNRFQGYSRYTIEGQITKTNQEFSRQNSKSGVLNVVQVKQAPSFTERNSPQPEYVTSSAQGYTR